jgi:stearoyl-CoA desaturase (Delta-9 desaturase)
VIFGLFHLPVWGYIVFTLAITHITVISTTIFLHRCQAHKSLDLHPLISHFFRFWLWLTTSIVTKEWVAIHRKHHTECETEQDPHSPIILGLKKVVLEGAELYRVEAKDAETLARYGRGTPSDWIEKKVYSQSWLQSLGVALMFVIDMVLFGIPGIAIWAVQMMWIPFWAAGIVNGVGHYWGYRNFECPDAARNFSPLGLIMGGEELHNNHHTFATSAKLSVRWWEFDIGWFYIRLLQMLGLAKVHRSIPKLHENKNKKHLDLDSLKAIINHRFQIMEHYRHEVLMPILCSEQRFWGKHGKRFLRYCSRLLAREESLIKQEEKHLLQAVLNRKVLDTVYQFRLKLQEIWHMTPQNQSDLLDTLHKWCRQAEATGIAALQDFAKRLRYYSHNECGLR